MNYGIRTLRSDEKYKIGDICRCSRDWDVENDCESDTLLPGTCATYCASANVAAVRVALAHHRYGTGQRVLLSSDNCASGYNNDQREIVMLRARVIKFLD